MNISDNVVPAFITTQLHGSMRDWEEGPGTSCTTNENINNVAAKALQQSAIQLTINKKRHRAKQFYEGLGFIASHEGMKLHLI